MTPLELRNGFLENLNLVGAAYADLEALDESAQALESTRKWIVSEGLFVNAWAYWEAFLEELLVLDLAREANGTVVSITGTGIPLDVRKRLAAYILNHPDHPKAHVNWAFDKARTRAREHLPGDSRFTRRMPRYGDLENLRKIRNAIAHRNDSTRKGFEGLVEQAPFSLTRQQVKSLTVGEFLVEHTWSTDISGGVRIQRVFAESILILRENAKALVP